MHKVVLAVALDELGVEVLADLGEDRAQPFGGIAVEHLTPVPCNKDHC